MRRNSFPQILEKFAWYTCSGATFSGCWKPEHYSISRSRASACAPVKDVDRSSRELHTRSCPQTRRFDESGWTVPTISRRYPRTTWPRRSRIFYYCQLSSWDYRALLPVDSMVCGFVFFFSFPR